MIESATMHTDHRRFGRLFDLVLGTLLTLLFILGPIAPLSAAPAPTVHTQTTASAFDQLGAEAQAMVLELNRVRTAAGLTPLAVHPLLNLAAQAHVNDMIASQFYAHRGSDGSDVRERIARTGYEANGWAGENWVAMGGVQEGLRWWLNSAPHRANIYNPNWVEMGIGVGAHPEGWGTIFVTVFSRGSVNQASGVVPPQPVTVRTTVQAIPSAGAAYTIQSGDTLSDVATRYGLTWQELAAYNGLDEYSVLSLGQVIRLPGNGSGTSAGPVTDGATATSRGQYAVQPGDTLLGIALNYGMTWQELASFNGMTGSELLQVGQLLWVPVAGEQDISTASTYIIEAGDTIISIAVEYGLDWNHLLDINGFNEHTLLQIGQTIRLN